MKKILKNTFFALFAGALLSASLSYAASLPITANADAFMRGDLKTANAATGRLLIGETAGGGFRGLLSFDLSALPAGATINSVQLVLHLAENDNNGALVDTTLTLALHAVTQAWTEASVSWNNASTSTPWTPTAGGTFDPTVLSSQTIPTKGATGVNYTWDNTAAFLSVVSSAYANGTAVSFLLKDSDEGSNQRELVRFVSKDDAAAPGSVVAGLGPQLIIDYTVGNIPEPSAYAVILSAAGLVVAMAIRSRKR